MFKDYYDILDIDPDANQDEIKNAFRKQSKKWHPDKNQDADTTDRMKDINEAYIILNDTEARKRYDKEYNKFRESKNYADNKEEKSTNDRDKSKCKSDLGKNENKYKYDEYTVTDDKLKDWIDNAKRQALDLAKKSLKEFGEVSYEAAKEGAKGAAFQIAAQVGCMFIIVIFVLVYSFLFG